MLSKRNVLVIFSIVFIFLLLITTYVLCFTKSNKDVEQVAFLNNFVSGLGESADGRWLALDKLYDKSMVKDIINFPWNISHNLRLKQASKVEPTVNTKVSECYNFLSSAYKLNSIEIYNVTIRDSYGNDSGGVIVDKIEDFVYLTKKDNKYYLLSTQKLYDDANK